MEIKSNKSGRTLIIIQSFIVIWYIFFSHFDIFSITQYSAVLKLALLSFFPLVTIFINLTIKGIEFKDIDLLILLFIIILFIGSLYSPTPGTGLFATLKFLGLFLVFIFYCKSDNWETKMLNMFYIFSLIYVIVTILHFLYPSLINSISNELLSSNQSAVSNQLFQYGFYAGIAGQTGYNASIIVIFISIVFSKLIIYKNRKVGNSIFLLLGLIALFLTAKRGPLVGIIIAGIIVVTIIYIYKNHGNITSLIKYSLTLTILVIGVYLLTNYISALRLIFERFNQNESFFSNRGKIFEDMLVDLNEFWLFGNGTASLTQLLEVSGHNIYLQLLYENGIVGLSIILFFVGKVFLFSLKTIKMASKLNSSSHLIVMLVAAIFFQINFLIFGITESVIFNPTMFLPYLIMVAVVYSTSKKISSISKFRN